MANAKAKGKRPQYFADEMSENHFSMTMSLIAELAVARERNDTLERILISKGVLTKEEIEGYIPDADAAKARQLSQVEYSTECFGLYNSSLNESMTTKKVWMKWPKS